MKSAFADTSYFVASLIPRDRHHDAAVAFSSSFTGLLVTTEYVLLESANFFARPPGRERFLNFIRELYGCSTVEIVRSSDVLFARGLTLFAARPDKEWSLTDCISMQVMTERGLTEAVTADTHFEQAGFRILLRA